MTLETIKTGLQLLNVDLTVGDDTMTIKFNGITITIPLSMDDDSLDAALFLLNTTLPGWFYLVKEALAEESKKGGEI